MAWSVQACFVIRKHGMFKTSQPTESGARLQWDPSCAEAEARTHGLGDSPPWTEAQQSLCLFCKPCQDNCCKWRRWGRLLKRACACGLGVPGKPGAAGPLGSQGSVSPGLTQVPSMPSQGQVLDCTWLPKSCQLEGNPCLVANSSTPVSRDHIPAPSSHQGQSGPRAAHLPQPFPGRLLPLLTRRFPSCSLSRQLTLTLCDSSKRHLITEFADDPSSYDLAWYLYSFRLCPKIICICLNG